jgi:hypothetical protein
LEREIFIVIDTSVFAVVLNPDLASIIEGMGILPVPQESKLIICGVGFQSALMLQDLTSTK